MKNLRWKIQDSGAFMERRASGLASVSIGDKDLSNSSWGYQVYNHRTLNKFWSQPNMKGCDLKTKTISKI